MTIPSLSLEHARTTNKIRGLNGTVADLQARVAAGAIRWLEIYNLSSNAVTVHVLIETTRNLSGIAQWVKDDTGTATEVGPLYTDLQTELVVFRDFAIANVQTAVELDGNGKKIEPALTSGERTALGAALVPLKTAIEAVPGVG